MGSMIRSGAAVSMPATFVDEFPDMISEPLNCPLVSLANKDRPPATMEIMKSDRTGQNFTFCKFTTSG